MRLKKEQKKIIPRKRHREWKNFLKKVFLFISIFSLTLVSLVLVFKRDNKGLLNPLSFGGKSMNDVVQKEPDVSELKKVLGTKKIAYEDIKVSSSGAYMVRLKSGEDIILSSDKDLTKQLSSLQVIYSRLTMEGRGLKKLDLRYDKPIVVFK